MRPLCSWELCRLRRELDCFILPDDTDIRSRCRGLAPLVIYEGPQECSFSSLGFGRAETHTVRNFLMFVCLCSKAPAHGFISLFDARYDQHISNDRSHAHLLLRYLFEILVVAFRTVSRKFFTRFKSRAADVVFFNRRPPIAFVATAAHQGFHFPVRASQPNKKFLSVPRTLTYSSFIPRHYHHNVTIHRLNLLRLPTKFAITPLT